MTETHEYTPVPVATATHTCYLCGKGIYQCGHDEQNRPYWLHVDGGYRTCTEDDDLAVATPF